AHRDKESERHGIGQAFDQDGRQRLDDRNTARSFENFQLVQLGDATGRNREGKADELDVAADEGGQVGLERSGESVPPERAQTEAPDSKWEERDQHYRVKELTVERLANQIESGQGKHNAAEE